MPAKHKAVVLLSGGLDSAVALHMASDKGYDCHALTFDYGQRHKKELARARFLAKSVNSSLKVLKIDLPWKGSSLVDAGRELPKKRNASQIKKRGIPNTYVPGRNTIFLSLASSYAETVGASFVFIGAHSEDSSGYPDCRKSYLEVFNKVIKHGTKAGMENRLRLKFPLIGKSKKEIILLGKRLGVPFQHTWSCYRGGEKPCGACDSCVLRAKGFMEAGIRDPLLDRGYGDS